MSVLNRVEMKLNELSDTQYSGVGISNSISVRERNGKWYIYGRIYPNKGDTTKYEYVQKSTNKKSTQQNLRYINNHLQQILWDVSNTKKEYEKKIIEENEDNDIPYLGEVGKSIIDNKLKNKEIEIETHTDYMRKYNKYILPYFKDFKIHKIKPSDIEKFQIWLMEKFSINSIKNIRGVLSIILEFYKRDGIITVNPIKNSKTPKTDKSKTKNSTIKSLNTKEMNKIFSKIDDFINKSKRGYSTISRKQLKGVIYVMYGSGIRSGEIVGLQWKDIDFINKTISINKSVRDGRIKSTKTDYSDRVIDITDECEIGLKILKEIRKNCKDDDFILQTQYGGMYDDTHSIDRLWKQLLDECKIERRNLYNLRHTFATTMLQNGLDIVSVSKILGHKDITVTIQRYIDGENNVKPIKGLSVRNHSF